MNSPKMIALAFLAGLFSAAHATLTDQAKDGEAQPDAAIQIADQLVGVGPVDRVTNCPYKVHVVKLQAGTTYVVSMSRKDNKQPFYPWLRIEDSAFKPLVPDPMRVFITTRTRFTPAKDDTYRIIASSQGGVGEYVLRIAPDEAAKTGVDDEGFLLRWLVLAPIPLAANQSGAVAIGKEQIKNEAKLLPKAGQKVKVGDKEFVWKEHVVDDFLLNFETLMGGRTEDSIAYAVTYVVAPAEFKAIKMKTGSDDQHKIYLNGKAVITTTGNRPAAKDQDTTEVSLRQGVNVLVAKVINEKSEWALCVRFTDMNDRPLNGLKCKTKFTK